MQFNASIYLNWNLATLRGTIKIWWMGTRRARVNSNSVMTEVGIATT